MLPPDAALKLPATPVSRQPGMALDQRPRSSKRQWELSLVAGMFLALGLVNWYGPVPIISIFPYLLPVLFIAWRHGLAWSFAMAGLGTLAAWPNGYTQEYSQADLFWAGFTTYGKLTVSAVGFILGKKIVENKHSQH